MAKENEDQERETAGCQSEFKRQGSTANCDQEAWVKQAIMTAMKMAIALFREKNVGAAEHLLDNGMEGVAEGAAVEIIKTLGMDLEYVNIRKPLKLRKLSTGSLLTREP